MSKYVLEPYDSALVEILENGKRQSNRTGIDTLSVFGLHRVYEIGEYFPVLTRRKMYPKSIFAELIWFLSGSTNINDLEKLGSGIWTPWRNKAFEKKHGYVDGAIGPCYGYQLRNFGGKYLDGSHQPHVLEKDYSYPFNNSLIGTCGYDQLSYMINTLRNDPTSRRNLISLWNPRDIFEAILPPCALYFQILCDVENKELTGFLTQRSGDMPIGIPQNISFYSAFIYLLAQQTGYKPHKLIHNIGDAHIYVNQLNAVEKYLSRETLSSPKLEIRIRSNILDYEVEDFNLIDYIPLPSIKIPVTV
jgi:thymidylate synthase